MWPPPPNMNGERMPLPNKLIAVSIDKDRGSQIALKWTVDHLLARGQTVLLIHVKLKQSSNSSQSPSTSNSSNLSLVFVCLCMLCFFNNSDVRPSACMDLDYPMEYLLPSTDIGTG